MGLEELTQGKHQKIYECITGNAHADSPGDIWETCWIWHFGAEPSLDGWLPNWHLLTWLRLL